MLKEVKGHSFDEINASAVALVDFNATWCGPCKMMAPILNDLSDAYAGQVDFYGVDTDENSELAAQFGIMSIPTLIIFKNGSAVAKRVGAASKADIDAWIKDNM